MRVDPLDVAIAATEALESASIDCAVGCALALGIGGVPRATLDVDLNVFAAPADVPRAIGILCARVRSRGLADTIRVRRTRDP